MTYNSLEIQYRMQPFRKIEGRQVTLLPMSAQDAQDALTDMVLHEIMHCRTAAEAREIEQKLELIKENTDLETASYIGQVQETIRRLE